MHLCYEFVPSLKNILEQDPEEILILTYFIGLFFAMFSSRFFTRMFVFQQR